LTSPTKPDILVIDALPYFNDKLVKIHLRVAIIVVEKVYRFKM